MEDQFNQPGHKIFLSLETLLMQACKQDDLAADLYVVCDFYKPDFDREWLHTQNIRNTPSASENRRKDNHCRHQKLSSFSLLLPNVSLSVSETSYTVAISEACYNVTSKRSFVL